ncbi:MAG: hypothetical protein WBD55_11645 [Dehalococcoidia bacterium]
MRFHPKLLLAAMASGVVLAVLASTATANRGVQFEPAGAVQGTAGVTFTSTPAGRRFTSLVTLRGSLHRTIAKTTGSLAGVITDCRSTLGEAGLIFITIEVRCELTLPWHVRYVGFTGTLPNIRESILLLLGIGFRVRDLAGGGTVNCLYAGNVGAITSQNPIRSVRFGEEAIPTITPENETCEESENASGIISGAISLDRAQTFRLI